MRIRAALPAARLELLERNYLAGPRFDNVFRIDIMRVGHAMARPGVGAIFSPERRRLQQLHEPMPFANSDLSGFSIFEEAQYRVTIAAQKVLSALG